MHNVFTFSSSTTIVTVRVVQDRHVRARNSLVAARPDWSCSDPVPSEQNHVGYVFEMLSGYMLDMLRGDPTTATVHCAHGTLFDTVFSPGFTYQVWPSSKTTVTTLHCIQSASLALSPSATVMGK